MHDYTSEVRFEGDASRAFDLLVAALTPLGFRVTERDSSSVYLAGPGMSSTKQPVLLGASRIRVARDSRRLVIEAELGGLRRMSLFVALFPLLLSLFLGLLFLVIFSQTLEQKDWILPVVLVTGGNVLLWLVLAPFLIRYIRKRTVRGIDALLNNIAAA